MFLPPARAVVNKTPNSSIQIISGVGHVCNIERPDRFNEIAIEFLLA
jgi:pimeloyl-ACP methyl ester carboxylesterase